MDDNSINLMDEHPVQFMVQNQPSNVQGTINKYVIKKINDSNDLELFTLKTNQSETMCSLTPSEEWLTFEFIRKEKLFKMHGKLYGGDQAIHQIEIQLLNSQKQWVANYKDDNIKRILTLSFNTNPITAYGLRLRGKSNIANSLQFINFNIYAKARYPYVEGKDPWDNVNYLHDKYEIVNIMYNQPIYKKIDNLLIVNKRPVITKQFDLSNYDIAEITGNKNQDIYILCQHPQWLTFEFQMNYKLSQIEIQHYIKDRRKYEYEIEVMDKNKNWIQVDSGKSGYSPIEVAFPYLFASFGIRIRGKSNGDYALRMCINSMKILAQRGKPIIIEGK